MPLCRTAAAVALRCLCYVNSSFIAKSHKTGLRPGFKAAAQPWHATEGHSNVKAAENSMTGLDTCLLRTLELRALAGLLLTLAAETLLGYYAAVKFLPWWPAVLLAAEVAFLFLWRQKKEALNIIPDRHEPDGHDGWAYFEKWHSSSHYNVKVLAIAELIKCWFDNVPIMEIRRGNAAELVARGYFYKNM